MKLGVETLWSDRKRVLGMPLTFTKYFLSEDRLFMQTGLLNMKMEEVLLYRVSDIVSIKDDSLVIETTTDRVRVEFAKFAVSTNNTAEKEAAKQKAAALAARKEQKEKEKKEKQAKKEK